MDTKNLQVHSPMGPHYSAYIVGTPEALQELAIAAGSLAGSQQLGVKAVKLFSGDGEEYDLNVICMPWDSRYWDNLQPPYTEDYNPQGMPPVRLVVEVMNRIEERGENNPIAPKLFPATICPPDPNPPNLELEELGREVDGWIERYKKLITHMQSALAPSQDAGQDVQHLARLNQALEGLKTLVTIKKTLLV